MTASIYRELARWAGVHIYNEGSDTFYLNRSYVCIHANGAGSRTITFPQAVDIYDALTENLLQSNTSSYTRSYADGETFVYRYQAVP